MSRCSSGRPNFAPFAASSISDATSAGLGMGGHLADLDDDQLKALVSEIEQMKAVPITEPEPVSMRVDPKGSRLEDK